MRTFVEDYIADPPLAIASAIRDAGTATWPDNIDDSLIYEQISSPEFRLYEELVS